MSLLQKRSSGRPTKTQQLHIQSTLREYYEKGMSASFTSNKTRTNIKTVCYYFNKWTTELKKIEEADFVVRQIREKERVLLSMECMLEELYGLLEEINNEIKSYKKEKKPVPKHLFSSKLQVLSTITALTQQRADISMAATVDFSLDKLVEEVRGKVEETNTNPYDNIKYY